MPDVTQFGGNAKTRALPRSTLRQPEAWGAGWRRARPLAPGPPAGDVLYSAVDEKPKRSRRLKRVENIRTCPDVAVLVDHYEEDWARLWWVRLEGTARVLDEGPEREHALALLRSKYEQYRAEPPTGAVIAVHVGRWRGWSSAE